MRKPAACFFLSVFALTLASTSAHADEASPAFGPPTVAQEENAERVRVHVTTDKDVTEPADVFARAPGTTFRHLCTAPCEAVVPPSTRLAVRMNKSDEDGVGTVRRAYGSDVDVAIGPPSRTSTKAGAILAITGAVLLVGGVAAYVSFASQDGSGQGSSSSPVLISGKAIGLILGVPLGIVGLSLGCVGAALLASSSAAPEVRISPHTEKKTAAR